MADFTKNRTYGITIEPFNNQLVLYYWQFGDGRMKAYIYRPIETSYYQIAKDFISTYPQYVIDFPLHNYFGTNNLVLTMLSRFFFDSTNFVYQLYFDFNMNYLGSDLTNITTSISNISYSQIDGDTPVINLQAYNETYFSHIRSEYLYVPNQGNTTFQLREYQNIYVIQIAFSGVYRSYIFNKILPYTDCCVDACCYPSKYQLIS